MVAASCRITASLGVAASKVGDKDVLIAEADAALYEAKRRGKNCTVSRRLEARRRRGAGRLSGMGLLDDAIREHLDLKRRRGADPSEIERAEREALGPVRRGPEPTGDEPVVPEAEAGTDTGYRESDVAIPESDAPHPLTSEEPWDPFQEDPELRALDEHEELPPYEAPRAPDGRPAAGG